MNILYIIVKTFTVKNFDKGMEKDTQVKLPRILCDLGERKAIMKLLNVSYPTISSALAGKTRTKKALRIRALALKRGAVEIASQNNKA